MNKNVKMLTLHGLQFFADGADTGSGGESGVSAGASLPAKGVSVNAQNSPSAPAQIQSDDRVARFEAMIKGEYKDLYDQRMSDTIQKRLKGSKETVDRYNALTPTLEILARKYNISDINDVAALNKAIEEDDSYFEEEALDRGISVQDLKEIKRMERENKQLKEQMRQQQISQDREKIYADWMRQSDALKGIYPGFDLSTELTSKTFVDLLKAGIDVRTAFEVIHKDEIIPAAMQYTAQQTARKVTNSVMANANRPRENGTSGQAASVTSIDVSKMTKQQRQELARRAALGEKITFN